MRDLSGKYLLTIIGHLAFTYLIPGACALFLLYIFVPRAIFKELALKLALFSLALVIAIPASVRVSEMIDKTYQASIEASIEAAKQATAEIEKSADGEQPDAEEEGFLSGIFSSVAEGISDLASGAVDWIRSIITRFMEALAIMLVTSCAIPLLVLAFFLWLAKAIFGVAAPINSLHLPRRPSGKSDSNQLQEV